LGIMYMRSNTSTAPVVPAPPVSQPTTVPTTPVPPTGQ
jgi:hypothetical protein